MMVPLLQHTHIHTLWLDQACVLTHPVWHRHGSECEQAWPWWAEPAPWSGPWSHDHLTTPESPRILPAHTLIHTYSKKHTSVSDFPLGWLEQNPKINKLLYTLSINKQRVLFNQFIKHFIPHPPWTTTSGLKCVENLLFSGSISPGAKNPWR